MINLLLLEDKQKIRKFYRTRLAILVSILFLISIIVGTILLLPSLFLVTVKETEASDSVAALTAAISFDEDRKIEETVRSTSLRFNVLLQEDMEEFNLSNIFKSIIDQKTKGIQMIGFFYQVGEDGRKIVVRGHATNRDTLIEFTNTLKENELFSDIDLPVSNLVKSEDISFSFSVLLFDEQI